MNYLPKYIELWQSGELRERTEKLHIIYSSCCACPRKCQTDRVNGEYGSCKTPIEPKVSSVSPHFGEEPSLVGFHGSGTIFFTGCNLNCVYCQNYDISQLSVGEVVAYEQLAGYMLYLQERGCHNINFVTPTHQVYAILRSLEIAVGKGLKIPLVYNSGGYECIETLKLLDGIIDIYMPDFKYWYTETGKVLSGVADYSDHAKSAIREMYRQVGDLKTNEQEIAYRGLIVRHLVLPGYYKESRKIIDFITGLSTGIYLNIMDQYRPEYKACGHDNLKQTIDKNEYRQLRDYAIRKGARLTE